MGGRERVCVGRVEKNEVKIGLEEHELLLLFFVVHLSATRWTNLLMKI